MNNKQLVKAYPASLTQQLYSTLDIMSQNSFVWTKMQECVEKHRHIEAYKAVDR